jgi:hypothetical protein
MANVLSRVVFGGAKPQTEFEKKQFDTHFSKKKIKSIIRAKINPLFWICKHDF